MAEAPAQAEFCPPSLVQDLDESFQLDIDHGVHDHTWPETRNIELIPVSRLARKG